ncbi:peroxisomal targeting signal receptor [Trichomonascus vanleenenianus]|uniref:Pex5p n=1 Tax=Trichomonascus vanleenenianus TaxID=2268995 RepID=UPI003EC99F9B
MSFMNSGSECSTSRNPLAQLSKHTTEDRSLQHERMNSPGAPGAMSMRSGRGMSAEDQQMMDRFAQGPQMNNPAFNFEAMHREMSSMYQGPQTALPRASGQQSWVNDFQSAPSPQMMDSPATAAQGSKQWATEFGQAPAAPANPVSMSSTPGYAYPRYNTGMFMGPSPALSQMNLGQQQQQQPKVQELDSKNWEEQFRQIEEDAKAKEETTEKEAEVIVDENGEEYQMEYTEESFESVWERIKTQVLDNAEDWTSKDAWDRDFDEFTHNRPEFGDYQFEENNPYMEQEDPYAIGVSLMDTGAKLSVAALCFEAALQKKPDHVDAWARLGACQAQNEKEDPAIRALERCIKLDPGNLGALMNLSVSYTNEGCENAAYATLEKWLATKYPTVVDQARTQEPRLGNEDRFQLHSRVTELFIRAAQLSPDGANMDADVQVGLGVLFYGNEEYEKAVDCFNAAIAVRPNDPLLWNRLGATLANSNRSEEAIDAYYKALELRPSFVRARYNLGVSCINIGCYKEAAQHLLSALSLHKTDGPEDDVLANQSTNLYETLRRVFLAMDRRDLVEKVGNGMNVNDFRSEFDF